SRVHMGGQSVCVPPLSPCLTLAFLPPDNFSLSSFNPNFYAILFPHLYNLSSLFFKPIKPYSPTRHKNKNKRRILLNELNLKDTELRLGLPGTEENTQEEEVSCVRSNKRQLQTEENREEEESTPPTNSRSVNTAKEKGTKDLELYQRTRIKMEIGCWLVMFHGICSLPLI
ncbi:unnamed protein product, partial [Thlaspi arvense]